MLLNRGAIGGGFSMDGWPCYILAPSPQSHIFGVRHQITEDRSILPLLGAVCPYLVSTLAMSDEIAQDEEDAEDYDLEALEGRTRALDDDDVTLVDRRGPATVSRDDVVFEIGDEEAGSDGEDLPTKKRQDERTSLDRNHNGPGEREGLMRSSG
jgi:hypothetical protein